MSNSELDVTPYDGIGYKDKFYMIKIEVDGVEGNRFRDYHTSPMFSLKQEDNEFGEIDDSGLSMNWRTGQTSEKHWLKCGTWTPLHARCPYCGERYMDEEVNEVQYI